MPTRLARNLPTAIIWLIVASLLGGILWRLEVEWHGWNGYGWTGYFHWAVPVALLMCLAWLHGRGDIPRGWRRPLFLLVIAAMLVGWGIVMRFALYYHLNFGPGAVVERLRLGQYRYRLYASMVFPLLPMAPLLMGAVGRLFGKRMHWGLIGLGALFHVLAVPLSLFLLVVLRHDGGADTLNAIKSGLIWPWIIAGLCLPYLPVRR